MTQFFDNYGIFRPYPVCTNSYWTLRLGCSWQGWPISWLLPWSTLNTSWMSTRFMWLQTTSLIPWRGNRWIEELWSWLSWLPENQANDAMPRNTDQDQCTAVMSLPAAKKPRIFELPHYVMPLRGQWQFSEKKGTEGITCLRPGHRHSGFETQRRQWKMQFVSSTRVKHTHITDKFVRTMSRTCLNCAFKVPAKSSFSDTQMIPRWANVAASWALCLGFYTLRSMKHVWIVPFISHLRDMRPKFAFEPLLFHNWVSVKNMKYQVVPGMRRGGSFKNTTWLKETVWL